MTDTADWTESQTEVIAFARALNDAAMFDDESAVIDYFAKPQKWTTEHARWVKLGRPPMGELEGHVEIILGETKLSPEAEDLLDEYLEAGGIRCSVESSDQRDALRELEDAGIVDPNDIDTIDEAGRVGVYGWTPAGRLFVEERRAAQ